MKLSINKKGLRLRLKCTHHVRSAKNLKNKKQFKKNVKIEIMTEGLIN